MEEGRAVVSILFILACFYWKKIDGLFFWNTRDNAYLSCKLLL